METNLTLAIYRFEIHINVFCYSQIWKAVDGLRSEFAGEEEVVEGRDARQVSRRLLHQERLRGRRHHAHGCKPEFEQPQDPALGRSERWRAHGQPRAVPGSHIKRKVSRTETDFIERSRRYRENARQPGGHAGQWNWARRQPARAAHELVDEYEWHAHELVEPGHPQPVEHVVLESSEPPPRRRQLTRLQSQIVPAAANCAQQEPRTDAIVVAAELAELQHHPPIVHPAVPVELRQRR